MEVTYSITNNTYSTVRGGHMAATNATYAACDV